MYNYLIKQVNIIDGTGSPAYVGDVGVYDDKLEVLAANSNAETKTTIDGKGRWLCPGFIDAHTHGDFPLGQDFASLAKLSQGITTQVAGMCGMSMAPVNPQYLDMLQDTEGMLLESFPTEMKNFRSFERYMEYAQSLSLRENTRFLVGHLNLRVAAMGYENREPTAIELANMKSMLEESMQAGAGGMSSGLVYVPSAYGSEKELTELCKVVEKYGGIYTTHMRNEADSCIQSVQESINTAKNSGVDLIISHHKLSGRAAWGKSEITLQMIDNANRQGISVYCDQYPYEASMTQLSVCAPPKYYTHGLSGMVEYLKDPFIRKQIEKEMNDPAEQYDNYYLNSGGWDGILICKSVNMPEIEGMTIADFAKKNGMKPFDVFCDVMIANGGVATGIYFCMCKEDLFRIIKNKHVVVGTDGILRADGDKPHPRAFGTFPHAIRIYVKEKHLLSLEEMIHKMTGLTAKITKIPQRGIIRNGYYADLILFDYDQLEDRATYQCPNELSAGIEYVFVNGKIAYTAKKLSDEKAGSILLYK